MCVGLPAALLHLLLATVQMEGGWAKWLQSRLKAIYGGVEGTKVVTARW